MVLIQALAGTPSSPNPRLIIQAGALECINSLISIFALNSPTPCPCRLQIQLLLCFCMPGCSTVTNQCSAVDSYISPEHGYSQ